MKRDALAFRALSVLEFGVAPLALLLFDWRYHEFWRDEAHPVLVARGVPLDMMPTQTRIDIAATILDAQAVAENFHAEKAVHFPGLGKGSRRRRRVLWNFQQIRFPHAQQKDVSLVLGRLDDQPYRL